MGKKKVHSKPGIAAVEDGSVHVEGPADNDVTLTPKAALETAKNIEDAAIEALIEQATKKT